ncbi:50S ribosomal protein L29 [bacterium BMS3Abin05]|nr:50S ribosomal protein L29 [bacterium BMS3Abin05]GBE28660.1 50S ribosomal protein L29 [bacterium BMS3Bbin03]HDK36244.1 50S ribosomal protein L29 [Bacteroidota bacterium]HDL78528.1 50S ribosomal protein L29 [Bacteroidota bacterium]HDZ12419.1 50S ribosomal protein L29 [Bacteroidota bacterium]
MKMFEVNELPVEELRIRLEEAREELSNLRFQKVLGQLNNPLRIRLVKRDIARLETVIHEFELGKRGQKTAENEESK